MKRLNPALSAMLVIGWTLPVSAAVTITAVEVGGDVVFTGGGTLNLSALSQISSSAMPSYISPSQGTVLLGATPASNLPTDDYYTSGLTGPGGFGTNINDITGDSGAGDRFGMFEFVGLGRGLMVPDGYNSGDPLAGTLIFTGTDFATLGVAEGSYVWSWGSGGNADSLTLNIVPEPASAVLLALGGLCVTRCHRCGTNTL